MIKRTIEADVEKHLASDSHKILFIWGPRRSGKTTLLKKISSKHGVPVFNFDLLTDRERFVPEREALEKLARELKIILVDEVQSYPEATVPLKILHDEFGVKIVATGSSELRQKSAQEFDSLAGRFVEKYCLPLSIDEIKNNTNPPAYQENEFYKQLGEKIAIFGSYPEIFDWEVSEGEKIKSLQNLVETYVLKDVINIYELKNAKLARDILTKIALQLGSEVSIREIANSLQSNVQTVSNYIKIFIKNYVLIPLPSFKTNIRRAVSENRKLYFYDLGIRNSLVKDFRLMNLRPDRGGVFENFIISEIEKHRKNTNLNLNMYFYREYGGKEVDLVLEDYHKKYTCLEIGTSKDQVKSVFPIPHELRAVNLDNYQGVLWPKQS